MMDCWDTECQTAAYLVIVADMRLKQARRDLLSAQACGVPAWIARATGTLANAEATMATAETRLEDARHNKACNVEHGGSFPVL